MEHSTNDSIGTRQPLLDQEDLPLGGKPAGGYVIINSNAMKRSLSQLLDQPDRYTRPSKAVLDWIDGVGNL